MELLAMAESEEAEKQRKAKIEREEKERQRERERITLKQEKEVCTGFITHFIHRKKSFHIRKLQVASSIEVDSTR
jgi:hypothetical protein